MAPKLIHLVRHGEGFHNLGHYDLHDPELTPHGRSQSRAMRARLGDAATARISLIAASPMRRTIQTALTAFGVRSIGEANTDDANDADYSGYHTLTAGAATTIITRPEFQEMSEAPCDTGSSATALAAAVAGAPVDLAAVREMGERWFVKEGLYSERKEDIVRRAAAARRWLFDLPASAEVVLVVSHGGFLHYLTEDWTDSERYRGTGWNNCELRSFTFDPSRGDGLSLVETKESATRRKAEDEAADKAAGTAGAAKSKHADTSPETEGQTGASS